MVGLAVILAISWLLLWLFTKTNLLALGISPNRKRIADFIFGLLSSSIACGLILILIIALSHSSLTINPKFTTKTFFNSSFWMLKSVLFEELIFRGALFYIAIKKIGVRNACILSSVAFGIYHWFSYGIFGNVPQMIYIFLLTGIAGLLFAYSFVFTKSLWLPIGLHLGWNVVAVVIFSQGPLGNQMLISSGGNKLDGIWTVFFFVYQIAALPLVTYFYFRKQINATRLVQQKSAVRKFVLSINVH
jgi:membrane protease YdiL (CAAX protease family)